MGKHTSKTKHHGKNGMKALKSNVGVKTASRARRTNIKYRDELSMENCPDLNNKASAQVNISNLELRSRRLKKTSQCTKAQVSTTRTPSKLRLISTDGGISRSASVLALTEASQNICLINGEANCEMEASIGFKDKQMDQHIATVGESQMIHIPRQKREDTAPYSPSPPSIYADPITNQVSGTEPDERAARDRRVSIGIRKTLFGAPTSRAEVEEFLAEVEQYEQKLLTARYNFDFQNGIPLTGRYEWISLSHS